MPLVDSVIPPRTVIPVRCLQPESQNTDSKDYSSLIEKEINNLHEIEVSPHQAFFIEVWKAFNGINVLDKFWSHYVSLEGLAVVKMDVIGIVAYGR